VRRFEKEFAAQVGATHAVALNSCTAALHLALDAVGLRPGQGVLVPTLTFAATAEVVRYLGAIPILVDCDPATGNLDFVDAEQKLAQVTSGRLAKALTPATPVVGLMPVHVGGLMMNVDTTRQFASRHNLWIVEDAAHAFPAAWRRGPSAPWQRCGEDTATATCFSFYANKTITTGEGGMLTSSDKQLTDRARCMSLHGLSHDAWDRYSAKGSWDYRIIAPGYKYNLTDIAASLGIHQLARAEQMRQRREEIASRYQEAFADLDEIELPPRSADRIHSWHLYAIRLRPDRLSLSRDEFVKELTVHGVAFSVHWRPLHLHPYYQQTFGWSSADCPQASALWKRLISLPIFSAMREEEIHQVIRIVRELCRRHTCAPALAGRAKSPFQELHQPAPAPSA
jgi:perosamine synthetase